VHDSTGTLVARVSDDARDLLIIQRGNPILEPVVDLGPLNGHRALQRVVVRGEEEAWPMGTADLPRRLDSIVWLEVRGHLRTPEVIPGYKRLRVLDAGGWAMPSLRDWQALGALERLGVAAHGVDPAPTGTSWFPELPKLTTLYLRGNLSSGVEVLATATPALRILWVTAVRTRFFAGFGELTQLEELRLWTDSTATGVYRRLQSLRSLGIRQPLRSLAFLADMQLEEFLLWSSIRDQALLALPNSLRSLSLSSPRLRKLDWVMRVPRLRELSLQHCVGLGDLRPLLQLQELEVLDLFACEGLEHASVLAELPSLKRLSLYCGALVKREELEWLARMRPDLEISARGQSDSTPVRRPLPGFDPGQ